MTKRYLINAVVGPLSERPPADNAGGGAVETPYGLYVNVDTGDIYEATGGAWKTIGTLAGNGAASISGLTSDTADGITVTADVTAGGNVVATGSVSGATVSATGAVSGASLSTTTTIAAGSKITATGSFGVFGHAAPASQVVLATGAAHTVDDLITLLQSYGLCKQS